MARPSKFTPEVQQRLCDAIRAGNYYEAACGYAGVDYSNFRRWIEKGEKAKSGPYREFCEAIQKAAADAEATIVAQWRQHIPENWQAARDFLARRFPERWGQRDTLTVLKKLASDLDKMTDDELYAIVNRSAGVSPGTGGPDEAPGARTASGDGNGIE